MRFERLPVDMESVRRGSMLLDAHLQDAFHRFTCKRPVITNVELSRWFKTAKIIGKHLDFIHMDVSFFKVKKLGSRRVNIPFLMIDVLLFP